MTPEEIRRRELESIHAYGQVSDRLRDALSGDPRGILRDLGARAAAMPTEDRHLAGGMVWEVRVPDDQAAPVRALMEAVRNS